MTNYNQLSVEQRDIIQTLINQKKSFTYISNVIDKDRTTISKEIKRNRYIKSNFYNPYEMEIDYNTCKKVCNVFYCKPYSSWQKHEIEVNHEYIRRVLPKGSNFSSLTKEQVKRLQDNINVIPRESLDGKTPFDLTNQKYPHFIKALKCKYIEPDKVSLNKNDILGDK